VISTDNSVDDIDKRVETPIVFATRFPKQADIFANLIQLLWQFPAETRQRCD
jgi:hypothetical protein